MYLKFYGLNEKPFSQTPDPKFLYWNDAYREALASLRYGIQERKGFLTMIGEAGTGKTTLLRKLLDDLGSDVLSVFLFNPNATFEEILEYTLSELGITAPSGRKLAMLQRLNEFLLAAFAEGKNTVLLIDEAQDLDTDVLESLRLLSNLETSKEKILQIVLSGQPELGARLAQENLRQLKQRIAVRCRLEPLQRGELEAYIRARLAIAGCEEPVFAPDTLDPIWAFARGIPRLVNTICDNALLVGYALGKRPIDRQVISEVSADLAKLDVDSPAPLPLSGGVAFGGPTASPPSAVASAAAASAAGAVAPATAPPTAPPPEPAPESSPAAVAPPPPPSAPASPVASPAGGTLAWEGFADGAPPPAFAARSGFSLAAMLLVGIASATLAVWASRYFPGERSGEPPGLDEPAASAPERGGDDRVVASAPERRRESPRVDDGDDAPPQPERAPASGGESPDLADASATQGVAAPAARPIAAREPSAPVPPVSAGAAPSVMPEATRGAPPAAASSTNAGAPTDIAAATPPVSGGQVFQLQGALATAPGRRVLIRRGDTLFNLATHAYGSANFTTLDILRAANPGIDDVNVILAGSTLSFPELTASARLVGGDGNVAVLAMATPTFAQAQGVQRKLQDQYPHRVEIQQTGGPDGRKLYRVFLRDFEGEAQAKRVAESLGSILHDPES